MGELFVLTGLILNSIAISQAITGVESWTTLLIVGTVFLVGGAVIRRMK